MTVRLIDTGTSFLDIKKYENEELLKKCIKDVKDRLSIEPAVIVHGKPGVQHRNIGFFSNESSGYSFSGQTQTSLKLTNNLEDLIKEINKIYNSDFNAILVNYYMDGSKNIGKHSDNEKYLGPNGVVCISYGATRNFRIRDKNTDKILYNIPTINNEIIHMGGNFQNEFTHEIPYQLKIKEERYSFTFRKHLK